VTDRYTHLPERGAIPSSRPKAGNAENAGVENAGLHDSDTEVVHFLILVGVLSCWLLLARLSELNTFTHYTKVCDCFSRELLLRCCTSHQNYCSRAFIFGPLFRSFVLVNPGYGDVLSTGICHNVVWSACRLITRDTAV